MASSIAASFSSSVPLRVSRASSIRPWAVLLSAKPSFTAVSIRASLLARLVVWLSMADLMASSFCSSEPERDSMADLISSWAVLLSAKPFLIAASMRPSLPSRLVVWLSMTDLMASSFCATVPFMASMAFWIKSSACLFCRFPSLIPCSIRASFSVSVLLTLLMASMMPL